MVFGEEFQLSVDDLVVCLGFYTEKTFNNHHFMQSLTDVPDSPGQKASLEIVSKMDLLCLYNIVNRVPIHLSVVMAIMFHKHTKKDLATLYIGPFVTKLLKSLGFEDKFKELQPIVDIIPQSKRYLLNLKIPSSDKNADLSSKIEQGFGANGLGLLSISDVPEYSLLRKNLLHLSIRLANVSEDVKRELEDADSRYSFGWSYGKEKQDGKLDKLKASFFANPILDVPTTEPSNIQRFEVPKSFTVLQMRNCIRGNTVDSDTISAQVKGSVLSEANNGVL
nr:Iron/ascorbate oxidoreductase [Ipomoea batatas]